MACQNNKNNLENCTCTYAGCSRKGNCCQCLSYHLSMNELPGCCFPPDVEKTFDRSFKRFASAIGPKLEVSDQ